MSMRSQSTPWSKEGEEEENNNGLLSNSPWIKILIIQFLGRSGTQYAGGGARPNITPTPTHRINAHDTDVTVVNLCEAGVAVGAMCSPWPSPLGGEGNRETPAVQYELL